MSISHSYTDAYNTLPDVIAADRTLTASGREASLDRLCTVILRYGLEERYGIRLIHSHHPVHSGELMIEEEEASDDGFGGAALTTRAVNVAKCGTSAAAHSWKFEDGEWLPLEFSNDTRVSTDDAIERQSAFANEFGRELEATGLSSVLGLCTIQRRFFEDHAERAREAGLSLLETTDAERRANVLRFADVSSYRAKDLIQTIWLAMGDDTTTSSCLPLCGIKCAIFAQCGEDNSGGHRSEIGHETSHQTSH